MTKSYDMMPLDDGTWAVCEIQTSEPACVNGVPQIGLDMEAADDLVDLLNLLAKETDDATIQ